MQKFKKYIVIFITTLSPILASAQGRPEPAAPIPEGGITTVIDDMIDILDVTIPLLIAIAVVVFLYGVIKYITAGGNEEKRTEARNMMIYGIIGLFVMVAVWGLVNVLLYTFGMYPGVGAPPPPSLDQYQGQEQDWMVEPPPPNEWDG